MKRVFNADELLFPEANEPSQEDIRKAINTMAMIIKACEQEGLTPDETAMILKTMIKK